ncbi:MAG: hypothetical protein IIB74_10755 [Proteobacteria bacterium]|nr:hypothetical protein [Pseudomonadota bacterium]
MTDRIKLAKAMFPKHEFDHNHAGDLLMCPAGRWDKDEWIRDVPDPFTDANDDYKVLEWMRDRCGCTIESGRPLNYDQWEQFVNAFPHKSAQDYEIGDYSRAALKVI